MAVVKEGELMGTIVGDKTSPFGFKTMNSVFKMMDFAVKMMNFVVKMNEAIPYHH